ncbi:RodZ domain-containing protein [uncultured Gilvimarinus sp.]|uniref:RodZ domain-containing protein n=1 Tax=uncultured Gilvimarinus sp. TaxID=1689143 RepID=UPI0030D6D024
MSDEVNPETQAGPGPGPGAKLAEAREQQGKSREQIASALNIQLDKIIALEADQYEKLFSPVFTRGYLRSYGKYLGLDGEALVREFETDFVSTEEPVTPSESLNVKISNHRSVWPARLGLVVVLLLLLGLLYWYVDSQKGAVSASATAQPVINRDAAEAAPVTNPAPSAAEPDYTPAIALAAGANAASESIGAETAEPKPVSAKPDLDATDTITEQQSEPATIVSDMSIGATSSADGTVLDELVLSFDNECWLEVLDANGDSLAADLQREGTSITLHGVAPFNVKLGNPDGVEIALNGSDVDVPDVAGSDKVVRFDVNTEA